MNKQNGFLDSLTARQLWQVTLPGEAVRSVSRFFSQEFVPVARRVWRNICHHGVRGLYHDCGICSLLIDNSNILAFGFLSRLLCKYCNK